MKYPIYRPKIFENTSIYVQDCIESTWISSKGKYLDKFENSFSEFTNIDYSTSVSNGTTALHLALCALGVGPGDEVIVPSFTYIASVNSINYVGAKPVFVDSERKTWNMDTSLIKKLITPKTKAIMAVHLYGNPCNMRQLKEICRVNNLYLIEDSAEALGSTYENKAIGSFGHVSTFSFFGNKTITTGEGGMVASNEKEIIDKVRGLKNQGASDEKYWYKEVGYNYRMTNICAAIGLSQIEQIEGILLRKKEIADMYKLLLNDYPVEFQDIQSKGESSYWLTSILTEESQIKDDLSDFLSLSGIETRPLFYPAHTMPMYKTDIDLPVSENLSCRGLNLPSYPDLSDDDIVKISESLMKFFNSY